MARQPVFGLLVLGAHCRNLSPEMGGVVHLAEVHEFVEDEVIANEGGSLKDAPVQGNGAAAGTRAPAGALVTDVNARDCEAVEFGEGFDERRELPGSENPNVTF